MSNRINIVYHSITEHVYAEDGMKLRTIHRTAVSGLTVPLHQTHTLTAAETMYVDSTTYSGSVEIDQGRNTKWYFGEGYIHLTPSSIATTYYTVKDYLGNIRKVMKSDGTIVQAQNYYAFGGLLNDTYNSNDIQTHKYNGKEYDPMHGLNEYDYGARHYDPAIGKFTTIDPLCEKYYHISPYAYCGGDPVNRVDPNGDTIRIDRQYQKYFLQTLESAFGSSNVGCFKFDSYGNCQISGSVKLSDKSSKKLFDGLKKVIDAKSVTNIIYAEEYNDGIINMSKEELTRNGGACIRLASENNGNGINYIFINPNAPSELPTSLVTDDYYRLKGKSGNYQKGDILFREGKFITNITDRTFHEIGHVIYDGRPQNLVIDYNNYLRKVIGLPVRKYDEKHNRLIR